MRNFALTVLLAVLPSANAAPPSALAERVDKHIAAKWLAAKVTPEEPADDAAFARRVYLDIIGRIPTVAETRTFLTDGAVDKRAKLADWLLDTGAFARHAANLWRREWVPQADTPLFATLSDEFEAWLATELRRGTGLDVLARRLMTANRAGGKDTPTTFLSAGENKPELLAANTTRAFLGLNLDCAQCHDHPFARWTRDQFWQTAAFFARPTTDDQTVRFEITPAEGKKRTYPARLLDDGEPKWPVQVNGDTGRVLLAEWVTAKGNPYFAKNAVNRAWAHLFGRGLVEPLDDLSGQSPASHPQLLEELATAFADSGYDLKFLYAAMVRSKAYQLSSTGPLTDPQLYTRATVRGLTGEQLYDSLRVAAGLPAEPDDQPLTPGGRPRRRFADQFRVERPGTAQRSILQALSLMNNPRTADLTDPTKSPTLQAVADAPFLNAAGRVEALFLAAYSRKPTADELASLSKQADGGADKLADLFWALLNSAEFNTTH